MPNLLVKPEGAHGRVSHVTPESAGWTYVGFDMHHMRPGEILAAETGSREVCLVWISGKGTATAAGQDFGVIGERMSPFEGAPHALYIPADSNWSVTAETDLELAVCSAPGGGDFKAKAIPPGTHPKVSRGKGSNVRHVYNIMPENDDSAHSLLVVEVITPSGNTSSYPSHKHDQDDLPNESFLEETYYHRIHPPQGFCLPARLYGRPLARRGDGSGGPRRNAGAQGLPSLRHHPRLRSLLPQRDGRAEAGVEVPQC